MYTRTETEYLCTKAIRDSLRSIKDYFDKKVDDMIDPEDWIRENMPEKEI